MRELPIIELRIKELGEQIHGAVMLHHEEIESYIRDGVEQALQRLPQQIINQAADEAAKQVHAEIHNYFSFGAGAKAIRIAVTQALAPIAEILAQGLPLDGGTES